MAAVSKSAFVESLLRLEKGAEDDIPCGRAALETAAEEGWLEETGSGEELSRGETALILHRFMRRVLKLPDLPDTGGAEILRDLYDCRVCAAAIAQVYLRGLLEGISVPGISEKGFLIFDGKRPLSPKDAASIPEKLAALCLRKEPG
ncbi:MAG: hypothetical protein K6E50_12320 [Lachnospiraceae bacterium]|nr:hypothetical protein [Lachnospiraceae bacterium]